MMKRTLKFLPIFFFTCLAPPGFLPAAPKEEIQALSQMNLEDLMKVEVVYGASKAEQRTREAPSMVTVVTA
jgi:hypothetical protein